MNPTYRTWLIAAAIVAVFLHLLIAFAKAHYTTVKPSRESGDIYLINNFTGKITLINDLYTYEITPHQGHPQK